MLFVVVRVEIAYVVQALCKIFFKFEGALFLKRKIKQA